MNLYEIHLKKKLYPIYSKNKIKLYIFIFTILNWIDRFKREASKLNTADMLALLALIEANERNRYGEVNNDINSLEYPRYSASGYTKDDDDNGEWWNELVEPSVQYYGNPYDHIEQNARDRHSKCKWICVFYDNIFKLVFFFFKL